MLSRFSRWIDSWKSLYRCLQKDFYQQQSPSNIRWWAKNILTGLLMNLFIWREGIHFLNNFSLRLAAFVLWMVPPCLASLSIIDATAGSLSLSFFAAVNCPDITDRITGGGFTVITGYARYGFTLTDIFLSCWMVCQFILFWAAKIREYSKPGKHFQGIFWRLWLASNQESGAQFHCFGVIFLPIKSRYLQSELRNLFSKTHYWKWRIFNI